MKKIDISKILIYFFVTVYSLFCLIPALLTLIVSITDEDVIRANGYSFSPEKISFYAYKVLLNDGSGIINAYMVSIAVTLVGTVLAVVITAMAAYTLSNKNVKYRNRLALYFFITLIFNSGLVPWYLICKNLNLVNNFLSLLVPSLLFNAFNLFLVRNFMDSIPDSLRESATIDGAGDAVIAFKIYFPLSVPVLATISLFYGLAYWNDWFNAIMLVDNRKLYPLQFFLFMLKSQINMINELSSLVGKSQTITPPTESMKMATAIVTIGPIIILYPFLQRYFVKGLVIGSVKG